MNKPKRSRTIKRTPEKLQELYAMHNRRMKINRRTNN